MDSPPSAHAPTAAATHASLTHDWPPLAAATRPRTRSEPVPGDTSGRGPRTSHSLSLSCITNSLDPPDLVTAPRCTGLLAVNVELCSIHCLVIRLHYELN